MPRRNGFPQGTPSWIDISSADIEGTKAFYADLFGWTWEDIPGPDGELMYSMASKDGANVCGLGPQPQEMIDAGIPVMHNTYIAVDSCDHVHQAAVDAGATSVVEPFDVMDTGRMSYLVDPQGAHFGLWQSGTHTGAGVVNEPDAYTWAELYAPDSEAAVKFYRTALGIDAEETDMGGGEPYTMFKVGDRVVGGTMHPPMEQVPTHWHVYFGAADTEKLVERAKELGATILVPPMDTPVGKMASIHDPQGGAFSVIQLNEWPSE